MPLECLTAPPGTQDKLSADMGWRKDPPSDREREGCCCKRRGEQRPMWAGCQVLALLWYPSAFIFIQEPDCSLLSSPEPTSPPFASPFTYGVVWVLCYLKVLQVDITESCQPDGASLS